MGKEFNRKYKEERPVIAICYDFDKTLTPDDMQAQGFIQSVKYDVKSFWTESNGLAEQNEMDQNLAYMYKMIKESEGRFPFTKDILAKYGSEVLLFPGVLEWFDRINDYGNEYGVIIEHYIISSGLKEMIEGTEIAKKGAFEKIYASSFYFNERGVAQWPAQVVNYTNKTQFLFRIEKGVLDVNDPAVNDYFPEDKLRIPFRNIIYIGDSDTDIPCMKLVNIYGGHSIGVYNQSTRDKKKVFKMMSHNRIKYFAPADYSKGSELDCLIKTIIERTYLNEKLETIHYSNKNETSKDNNFENNVENLKDKLLIAFENSMSFANTHTLISDLNKIQNWNNSEKEILYNAAVNNNQIKWIINDPDVKSFYLSLISNKSKLSINGAKIKNYIDDSNDIF